MVRVSVKRSDGDVFMVAGRDLLGLVRYQAVNAEHYIDLTTTRELRKGDLVSFASDVDGTLREYMVWASSEPHTGDMVQRTYRCVWSLQGILSGVTSSTMPSNKTARQALASLLTDTNAFSVGTVEPTGTASASFWRMSAWEGLAELVKAWGGEVDVSITGDGARAINLLDHIGKAEAAFAFQWGGSEIDSVERIRQDGPEVCRIIPLGGAQPTDSGGYGRKVDITSANGGIPYLEDAERAAEMAGSPNPTATAYVENGEITDPAELKAWGLTVLESYTRPEPQYDVRLVEKYAREEGYVPALGDVGTIRDDALGAAMEARVYAITVDELALSVTAELSTLDPGLGAMASLIGGQAAIGATADARGTASASLLLTTTDAPYTSAITAYDRGTGGHNTFWRPGGNLVVGSGEFADQMQSGDIDSCYTGTGENAWFGSDGTLYLVSNANTIGNRKTAELSTSGSLLLPASVQVNGRAGALSADSSYTYLYGGVTGDRTQWRLSRSDGNIQFRKNEDGTWGSWSPIPYLPLSGGTLTGGLSGTSAYMSGNIRTDGIFTKDADTIDTTTAPSASVTVHGYQVRDVNDTLIGQIRTIHDTDGCVHTRLIARQGTSAGGGIKQAGLGVGVKSDGTAVYHVSNASAFRDAIGATGGVWAASQIPSLNYLPTAGGTITGSEYIKTSTLDRDGSNPSSDTAGLGKGLVFHDKDAERLGTARADISPTGATYLRLAAHAEKSDGTEVSEWLNIGVDKSGNRNVSMTTPAAWLTGLGLGSSTSATSGKVTAASGYTIESQQFAQWGRVCTLQLRIKSSSATTAGTTVATLASALKPASNAAVVGNVYHPASGVRAYLGQNLNIVCADALAANTELNVYFVWLV